MRPRSEVNSPARYAGNVAPIIVPERRHEVWDRDPKGDFDQAFFDGPMPEWMLHEREATASELQLLYDRVLVAARKTWDMWTEMKKAENKVPASKPEILGPYRVPDYERLDMMRFYMVCRWKLTKPLLLSVDDAALYAETEAPDNMLSIFLRNLEGLSKIPLAQIEKEARQNQTLLQVTRQADKYKREFELRYPNLRGA